MHGGHVGIRRLCYLSLSGWWACWFGSPVFGISVAMESRVCVLRDEF